MLVLSDLTKLFEVQCDACGHSLGTVLLQKGMPLHRLTNHEKNMGIYVKELLTIMHTLDT